GDDPLDELVGDGARGAGAGLVGQPVEPQVQEPPPPFADSGGVVCQAGGGGPFWPPLRAGPGGPGAGGGGVGDPGPLRPRPSHLRWGSAGAWVDRLYSSYVSFSGLYDEVGGRARLVCEFLTQDTSSPSSPPAPGDHPRPGNDRGRMRPAAASRPSCCGPRPIG